MFTFHNSFISKKYIRSLMICIIFFQNILFIYGQEIICNQYDPVLLSFINGLPVIALNSSSNVTVERIDYSDIDKKIIKVNDSEDYNIYQFSNYQFVGAQTVSIISGKKYITQEVSIDRNPSEIKIENRYQQGNIEEYLYSSSSSEIRITDNKNNGIIGAIILLSSSKISYFSSIKLYNKYPTKVDKTVEVNNDMVIISSYRNGEVLITKNYFKNGILMKTEYNDGRIYQYSTDDGNGEIIGTDLNGKIIEKRSLIRKKDKLGYLIYERVAFSNNTGYEYYLINK